MLKIGDEYGGGKIADIDATCKHGLIAAKADLPGYHNWDNAKKACQNLVANGYSDWRLPNKAELTQLYHVQSAVGGFVGMFYWSSSELIGGVVWIKDFNSGGQGDCSKGNEWLARPVRDF